MSGYNDAIVESCTSEPKKIECFPHLTMYARVPYVSISAMGTLHSLVMRTFALFAVNVCLSSLCKVQSDSSDSFRLIDKVPFCKLFSHMIGTD